MFANNDMNLRVDKHIRENKIIENSDEHNNKISGVVTHLINYRHIKIKPNLIKVVRYIGAFCGLDMGNFFAIFFSITRIVNTK